MSDINSILLVLFVILMIYIIIFIYSAISSDMITSCISFMIYLILLITYYFFINKLYSIINESNYEEMILFKFLSFYSTIIIVFIGIFLFVQLIYLFLNS